MNLWVIYCSLLEPEKTLGTLVICVANHAMMICRHLEKALTTKVCNQQWTIGHLPEEISKDITPLVNNLVAPVRAFNYFISFNGGREQKKLEISNFLHKMYPKIYRSNSAYMWYQ